MNNNYSSDFIRKKIVDDIESDIVNKVYTRFPPEPNGYLHIGHTKSIVLNFEIAHEIPQLYPHIPTRCNLRFDDTNPEKESKEYITAIQEDITWLGYSWGNQPCYTSEYFSQLYEYAVVLIKKGKAYVDNSSAEEIKQLRGTPTQAGENSPYRERSIEENLTLFEDMKKGKFVEGTCVLRAKINMAHPNLVMRDPTIYRIRTTAHHTSGTHWCVYPMYDFAHCLSDAIEGITHSLCTLEFENNRVLYEWILEAVEIPSPRPVQIEFARLNLSHTIMSKRKMKTLVDKHIVDGWNDPRLATISGLRRRGYTASAIKNFCKEIGLTKTNSTIEIARLEEALRTELNTQATRVMVVYKPVKLIIDNFPDDLVEEFVVENNQFDDKAGNRTLYFSKELYIESEDVMEDPPKGYNRLAIGREVRLKHAYYIRCTNIIKDKEGKIVEVHAEYDKESKGGSTPDKRKVKGTIHWVSISHSNTISIDMLDVLFTHPHPESKGEDFLRYVNPHSLIRNNDSKAELYIEDLVRQYRNGDCEPHTLQTIRKGYIIYDKEKTEKEQRTVFNFTLSLKDKWK